jgi:hypothetical protein
LPRYSFAFTVTVCGEGALDEEELLEAALEEEDAEEEDAEEETAEDDDESRLGELLTWAGPGSVSCDVSRGTSQEPSSASTTSTSRTTNGSVQALRFLRGADAGTGSP